MFRAVSSTSGGDLLEIEGRTPPRTRGAGGGDVRPTFIIKRRTQHLRLDPWANLLSSYKVIDASLLLDGQQLELKMEYRLR